jgi:hypothetical protein
MPEIDLAARVVGLEELMLSRLAEPVTERERQLLRAVAVGMVTATELWRELEQHTT